MCHESPLSLLATSTRNDEPEMGRDYRLGIGGVSSLFMFVLFGKGRNEANGVPFPIHLLLSTHCLLRFSHSFYIYTQFWKREGRNRGGKDTMREQITSLGERAKVYAPPV